MRFTYALSATIAFVNAIFAFQQNGPVLDKGMLPSPARVENPYPSKSVSVPTQSPLVSTTKEAQPHRPSTDGSVSSKKYDSKLKKTSKSIDVQTMASDPRIMMMVEKIHKMESEHMMRRDKSKVPSRSLSNNLKTHNLPSTTHCSRPTLPPLYTPPPRVTSTKKASLRSSSLKTKPTISTSAVSKKLKEHKTPVTKSMPDSVSVYSTHIYHHTSNVTPSISIETTSQLLTKDVSSKSVKETHRETMHATVTKKEKNNLRLPKE
ncbi:hypothetical protein K7432_012175 [Basidiobolus ranarum]|uniref:Uncharacterized protein n=1 Tax=Basidiobolus ranarum TaxID=34480 RepID=A0ABR2WLA0_9FUNG